MEIAIRQISQHNLPDGEKCDGTFTVDAKLILAAKNNVIQFTTVNTTPYQKRYPVETIDHSTYIDSPDRTIFFAYVDGTIGGQIRLRRNWNHYAYVEDIVVDVEFRRRGVGRALIQQAVQWAQDKQLSGMMLETQNNNVAACLLYQRCGFELGGFDRLLYQGQAPHTEEIALYWYLTFKSEK
ncbi:MAG: GNAT family N-acetyltransferase [Pyrinomonadaceae bacterium]